MKTVFARSRPVVDCSVEESRTKQAFKDECDISTILSRYRKTGFIDHINRNQGRFLDVSEVGDFRQAMAKVQGAQGFFMRLPGDVRARFNHDVAEFLDFVMHSTPEELEEAGLGGLKTAKVESTPPAPAAPVSPPAPAPTPQPSGEGEPS